MAERFSFAVQKGVSDTDDWYTLDIKEGDNAAKKYFSAVWQRLSAAVEKSCDLRNTHSPPWVAWKPWEWCCSTKGDYAGRKTWVAWCGNDLVGFTNVWLDFTSPVSNEQILYIEHLASFPGDQQTELWGRRYKYVGQAILAFAIKLSRDAGFDGRIGLHAENDDALQFYKHVAEKYEGGLFHPEAMGILGPTPHASRGDAKLNYLESLSAGANKLLNDYCDE